MNAAATGAPARTAWTPRDHAESDAAGLAQTPLQPIVVDERTLELLDRRRSRSVVRRRGWLVRRMLLLADVVGLLLAFSVAELLYPYFVRPSALASWQELSIFLASLPCWVAIAKLYGLYDHDSERTDHSTVDDVVPVFHMVLVCTCIFWFFAWVTHFASPRPAMLVWFVVSSIVFVGVGRAAARGISRRRVSYLQNTVIVGAGEVGQRVAEKLLNHPEYGLNLVGFIDSAPKERRESLRHLTILGGPESLVEIVALLDVERVVIAFSNEPHDETLVLLRSLKDLDIQVDIVPRLFEILGPGVAMHTIEGLPLIGLPPLNLSGSSRLLKRMTDIGLASAGLVLLAPLFALLAAVIKLDSSGPVFFRQVRMGGTERTFRIWKFRTMVPDAEEQKERLAHLNVHALGGGDSRMFKIPDDPRTTRVGRYLRRYSLDELPQLLNVLVGQMSFVGPRPLILSEDKHVEDWARKRLDIKPGITGPWQVLGRSGIPFSEMVNLDYLYVTSWSLWGDLKLMFRTLPLFVQNAHGETAPARRPARARQGWTA